MTLEEAKRLTNKRLAEQRKGYLSENAYRQSPEFKEKIKNRLVSIAEATTPLGDVQTAKDAKKAYNEGRYLDALGNAGMIAAGYTPLGPLARPLGRLAKRVNRDKDMFIPAIKDKDYRDLVKRETIMGQGPLAPQSAGAASFVTKKDYPYTKGISDLEQALIDSDPRFKDARFGFSGQNEDMAYDLADFISPKGYEGPSFFMGYDPVVGSDYALKAARGDTKGKLIAIPFKKDTPFEDIFQKTPITGNRKIIRDAKGNEDGSEVNLRVNNREQLLIPIDKVPELKQHVIGGRGLILPPGAGQDEKTMFAIKKLMKEGKYNAIE